MPLSALIAALLLLAAAPAAPPPRAWTDDAIATLELPLANPRFSPRHIRQADYYQIPERVIYQSYPVYHPEREPPGYWQWLHQQAPQVAFDPATLHSPADWIRAGEIVFNAPVSFAPVFFSAQDLRNPAFYRETGMPVAASGIVPFARWVIREKGKVELGSMGCATCHTRVLDNGVILPGAQGNNPNDRQGARLMRLGARFDPTRTLERVRLFARQFEMPWLPDDPHRALRHESLDQLIAHGEAIPPGVTARAHTSMLFPPQIPDLIGVSERRYLDHTGLVKHRSIEDLMRYSSLVQDMLTYARYGDFPPLATPSPGQGQRFSDAQLYALAQYLYSLQPPPSPHAANPLAPRGQLIFQRAGCHRCHPAPFYTNNKLIPVDGFRPPAPLPDVMNRRIGVDPRYTLQSRKGTGFYKVPSLKGLWYRSPLEHNGRIATLEDWFDPARLARVPGHEFGLQLPAADKTALIAFLRTL
jgi:hypothetical protein